MRARVFGRLAFVAGLVVLGLSMRSLAQPAPTDLADKAFNAQDVVRALAPRSADAPARRTRGLGVVPAGPSVQAAETERRSVSMQLQFEFDSADLTHGARERLDEVAVALRSPELSNGRFLISGHSDATGRYEYNLGLSKRRAEAVRDYLVARHGVEARRLVTVGKASDELMDPARPDSPVNRRVQLDALD